MFDLHHNFALVLTKQEPTQPFGALLDPIEHINSCLQLALLYLLLQLSDCFGKLLNVIKIQESLHNCSLCDHPGVIFEPVGLA